ncbi:MAG: flagellar assembly protein FliW [Planctomycetales bacterium]
MDVLTTRFGQLHIGQEDLISFSHGIPGLEHCRDWILLTDAQNESLGWLQCANQPNVAFAVVSPRRFVPEYQVRLSSKELDPLRLRSVQQAQVLVIVGKQAEVITLNLKAPLIINPELRLGRQVVVGGASIRHEIVALTPLRKSA